jgi:hypothetical protein
LDIASNPANKYLAIKQGARSPSYDNSTNLLFNPYAFHHQINPERMESGVHISQPVRSTKITGHGKVENPMSTIQDVSAEQLAKAFHHYREALMHNGCCQESEEESSYWERAPQDQRKLMVAAARLTLLELATATPPAEPSTGRKYYAKPGEADWGC